MSSLPALATNPYEQAARRKKADAIVEFCWEDLDPEHRIDPATIDLFRSCIHETVRRIVAKRAGQHPPSDETWKLVVEGIAERVRIARWGATDAPTDRRAS